MKFVPEWGCLAICPALSWCERQCDMAGCPPIERRGFGMVPVYAEGDPYPQKEDKP
jgi:hypothetical protein